MWGSVAEIGLRAEGEGAVRADAIGLKFAGGRAKTKIQRQLLNGTIDVDINAGVPSAAS